MGVKNGSDFDFNNNENEINHHQNEDHSTEEELILPSVRRMATLFQDENNNNTKNKTLKPRRMDLNCDTSELVGICYYCEHKS